MKLLDTDRHHQIHKLTDESHQKLSNIIGKYVSECFVTRRKFMSDHLVQENCNLAFTKPPEVTWTYVVTLLNARK